MLIISKKYFKLFERRIIEDTLVINQQVASTFVRKPIVFKKLFFIRKVSDNVIYSSYSFLLKFLFCSFSIRKFNKLSIFPGTCENPALYVSL